MSGCCYSCKHWESANIRQVVTDVKKDFRDDEEIIIELGGEKIRMRSWKYSMDESTKEFVEGIREGSIGCCNERLIKPWSSCEDFEPRITIKEDIGLEEESDAAYLACWTSEGCPFKEKCYKNSSYSYLG